MSKPKKCPWLRKPCIEDECMMWKHVVGADPQTGKPMDHFDCSFNWLPVMLVENARTTTGVSAAVESLRNEVVQRQDVLNNAVALGQREAAKRIGEDQCQKTIEHSPNQT